MNAGPTITSASFYKAEAGLISKESSTTNATAALNQIYNDEVYAVNLAEIILLVGVVLAPVGGAILALGLVTKQSKPDGAPANPTLAPGT